MRAARETDQSLEEMEEMEELETTEDSTYEREVAALDDLCRYERIGVLEDLGEGIRVRVTRLWGLRSLLSRLDLDEDCEIQLRACWVLRRFDNVRLPSQESRISSLHRCVLDRLQKIANCGPTRGINEWVAGGVLTVVFELKSKEARSVTPDPDCRAVTTPDWLLTEEGIAAFVSGGGDVTECIKGASWTPGPMSMAVELEVGAWPRMTSTPLVIAAYLGLVDVVELLLGHGADPNLACSDGWTPLMEIAFWTRSCFPIPRADAMAIARMLVHDVRCSFYGDLSDIARRGGRDDDDFLALFDHWTRPSLNLCAAVAAANVSRPTRRVSGPRSTTSGTSSPRSKSSTSRTKPPPTRLFRVATTPNRSKSDSAAPKMRVPRGRGTSPRRSS